jgi:hypothetical protein
VSHEISLAVWDVPSPVIAGRRTTIRVGVTCPEGCNLSGTAVDVHNDTGEHVGAGTLRSEPWPATAALYWAELDLVAPERTGELSLCISATPMLPHDDATSIVRCVVSAPPEHRVTLHVIDKTSGAPLANVDVRVGRFRAATDQAGIAPVDVPGGPYQVGTWKNGYEMASTAVVVAADATIDLELTTAREPDQPYWM